MEGTGPKSVTGIPWGRKFSHSVWFSGPSISQYSAPSGLLNGTAQDFACFTSQMLAKVKNTAGKKSVKQSNDPTAEHMGHTGLAWEPLLSRETVGFICTSLLDLTLCCWSSIKKGVTSLGLAGKKWLVLSNFKGCEWGRACDLLKLFNPLSF